ncbi:HTH domain-containing protein [Natrarchaeobaculum sulfurireducens]|uniref:Uncharacterized protein n=1 Tax=Natrarchaeobaculum sulfurireducens TaxID=2044521 RepID=A0A346PIY5_9EURY|nr:HTH domain-containing protein [Natrarchaeobaculum sulfurireducens]AXR79480.1 hypothetical protein AArc1_3175 [Natrarchaeobaculum sulfurireducens]AXR83248.1 hypothetical protein AArcMg_3264 [Natrarchaeobaculum sulfurireducens]
MSADKFADAAPIALESTGDCRIDCYVRASVPGPLVETVDAVVGRLERLREREQIAAYRVTDWPPEHHIGGDSGVGTRDDLVTEFERWASRHGHSLEPAFRRRERPTTYGWGACDWREQVRVPLVALAVYDESADTDEATDDDAMKGLRAVVPYTERPGTAGQRTHTVREWLRRADPEGDAASAHPGDHGEVVLLEGRQ